MSIGGGVIFGLCLKVDNFRLEVYSDAIPGAFVGPTGVKVRVKFGGSRDIRLPHFVANNDDNDDTGRRTLCQ